MAKRKALPPLTPRARELMNYLINSVALGTHDNDAEIGAAAKALRTTPARLATLAEKLKDQGWLRIKSDFLYPTAAALQWQNPTLSEQQAARILRKLN